MSLHDDNQQAVLEAALRWGVDKTAEQDLADALANYRSVKFYVQEVGGDRASIIFYKAGVEQMWAESIDPRFAEKMITQLNEQLAGGWNPDS